MVLLISLQQIIHHMLKKKKDREYKFAPSGFPGLETALGVLLTDLYHKDLISLNELVAKMSYMPGKLFFDGKRGILEEKCYGRYNYF